MTTNDEQLIPAFMPSLSAILLNAEDKKGEPLTYEEVIRIRDESPCIMMRVDHVRRMETSRGYRDIDPENCWYEWQQLRRELGRKPDLDPGPKFRQIRSADPEYQKTVQDARASLDRFRDMLPADGSPRLDAMVKTEITQGDNRAFMWLCNARRTERGFAAEFFEIPNNFVGFNVGDQVEVDEGEITDWMVNDDGVLYGGFSIRYQRSKIPEAERESYDA